MMLVGALIAIVVILLRASIPESPRWLANQGRAQEAQKILSDLTGENATGLTAGQGFRWLDIFSPSLIRKTVFVAGFWFCYDIAFYGISIYTPTILKAFTGGSQSLADVAAAVVSLVGAGGAAIGFGLVDRWGRRPLILLAFTGLTASLVILALAPTPALVALIVLFGLAELFANMGPGVLDFVYPTELFPTSVRAGATGFATAVSRVGAILSILVFPSLLLAWGLGRALWLFAIASVAGLVISAILAPETRGQSLESLEQDTLSLHRAGTTGQSGVHPVAK